MLGSRGPNGFPQDNSAEVSPLESLLQRAWLQSHKPKVQRRISSAPVTDVSVGRRGGSQPSSPAFSGSQPSSPGLSGIVSSQVDSEDEPENFFFHKSRLDASTVLISRFALPKLECYSEKTFIPKIVQWTVPSNGYGRSQPFKSLVGSLSQSSESPSCITRYSSGVTESEYSSTGSIDFEGQTLPSEPSPSSFFDDFFDTEYPEAEKSLPYKTDAYQTMSREIADLIGLESSVESEASDIVEYESCWADSEPYRTEAEISMLEQSSAYQAMAREISELISPNPAELEAGKSEIVIRSGEFRPSEELAALKMMEAYAAILTKHIRDVSMSSGTADSDSDSSFKYRTSDEPDTILTYFDDDWRSYLQNINQNFTPTSSFDFNLLLCGTGGGSKVSAASSCVSLTELLYRSALAVSQGKDKDATDLLAELREKASPYGNPVERMAHYFMEALVARMSGTGEKLYTAISNSCPSTATIFKAVRLYTENCPFLKLGHFFTIKSLVDASEGATRVHVISYGIGYGVEFPTLIQQLAERREGPPHLRITGIDTPHSGNDPCLKIKETGNRLEAIAKDCGVQLEFVALAGSWESFTARDMCLREDEVLAVCSDKLHTLLDESVMATSPREVVLRRIRSMNPKVFVHVGLNIGLNAPFFMTRFRESVKHYSAVFEGLEISMPPDDPDRVLVERAIFGVEIMNIVACEGQTRVERSEPYRQWQNRLQRAGFAQLPLKNNVFSKIKGMMAAYHKDYGVCKDEGWFLMGIRNHIVKFCSAWEPRSSQSFHQIL
ncbi:hypothetical protein KC19_7G099100 [Ceratodon purpureus]|uniref:Uncharacterized protein n=1 Tax=Ceratodon purpureus TaxID=3225 RepID=A0A8T0H9G0_CERPU|nr:hypothetical protein KC19_7G099100 [Ceratodon purpureus]